MNEVWRQYPRFPFILVSNTGILISLKNPLKPKMLRQRYDKDGYLLVTIRDIDQASYTLKVHRIVAETYLDNPNKLPYVNHKDEIKTP